LHDYPLFPQGLIHEPVWRTGPWESSYHEGTILPTNQPLPQSAIPGSLIKF
jgi:hypothetical protein